MKANFLALYLALFCPFFLSAQTYNPYSAKQLGKDKAREQEQKGIDAIQNAMFGTSSDANVADKYEFETSVNILLTTKDKKGKATDMNMQMLFTEKDSYYGVEMKDLSNSGSNAASSIVVFDYVNLKMVSFMDNSGQKMGITMDLNEEQISEWSESETESNTNNASFTKTGKKKDILGYSCEQYIIKSDDGEGECWVSNDKDLKIGMALTAMAQNAKKRSYDMPNEYPDGAILEMTFNHNEGSSLLWLATAINKNIGMSIQSDAYKFINM